MAPKRKTTNAKQSAHSKRHKTSSSSSSKSKKRNGAEAPSLDSAPAAPARSSAFPADKPLKESQKKDRKGKGPASIAIVKPSNESDDDESDEEDSAAGMDVDEELEELGDEQAGFLTRLDEKGMSTSRPALLKAHRKEKPAPAPRSKSLLSGIPLPAAAPLKSELKAQKKKEALLKKAAKKNGAAAGESDDEPMDSEEEGGAGPSKAHPEGELLDDLEEDDFAFGSGGSDDDLSVMSEMESMSEMSDMSDLDSEDLDEDDEAFDSEELEWEDEDGSVLSGEGEGVEGENGVEGSEDDSAEDDSAEDDDDDDDDLDDDSDDEEEIAPRKKKTKPTLDDDALEAAYAARPAAPKVAKSRPTKLPTIDASGRVIRGDTPLSRSATPEYSPSPEPEPVRKQPEYRSDPLGQRFGRPAVRQLLEIKDKKERVGRAREEIADLGREASGTGEGEGGLNLLKRLLSLTAPKFSSSSSAKSAGERPILVDREIRIMAMVSLLAVFVDVVPGYRIRPLTETEKEVKVSQLVARQREWEDGLVGVYKRFLEMCETEVNEDSALGPAALHCLCTLVKEKPDFNFAVNIMDVVVKRLGRKGWDDGHQACLETVNHLFINDTTTTASNSLHLVRLISRLVRARSFAIRPEVLSALLNLRLKDELGGGRVRASTAAIFREKEGRKGIVRWNQEKDRKGRKGGKAKEAMSKTGSKKAREVRKERAAIDKEMREAEGEINQEERERNMTETLKLLFALYFRIVKLDYRSPLLPAALEGLARFAHLVNIDFFRDLLEVLKGIIKRGEAVEAESIEADNDEALGLVRRNDTREKLLCIVTAFELLQGQGEALNIDLGEFVSALYALILPLALSPTFEETPYLGRNAISSSNKILAKLAQTEADLLFRALAAIFLTPRTLPSPIRTLAFSKRLMTSSLQWPPASQLRTLVFLRSLLIREPKLEAMLETGDRRIDGKWRGNVDEPERAEPEGTCWWEAGLYRQHPDEKIRAEAKKLLNYQRD
ncbi:CBF/Mak21 family-domain-containing protein [Leucosporidium creatinivorum]|uniref:CBF/Mak21 family-domain-containing protein n=1 Tax=Leucosporidium creatinivorum TaxID=106004 RepID=A0A1Y2E256_9BASI|nr:CBF/Mak21 family-domain-containing protein [Leucosporidium creatinivorum]